MKIVVPKEIQPEEPRTPMIPADAARLTKMGAEVEVETGIGAGCHWSDEDYQSAKAVVTSDRKSMLSAADLVLRIGLPPAEEIPLLKSGSIHIGFLDPFRQQALVRQLADQGVSAISMEMVPRITRAQKMDALSSQANLGGYMAVILGARHSPKIYPMMMTAAGTIMPTKVFVIGAGVAGLQAIATAKRLGAKVEAYDTRPVVKEQVESLGARFAKIDLGETGQTKDGYAKALSQEQLAKQREAMKQFCVGADVVITTAQVFGRKAPVIVTADMVAAMKPGSVIVDMAVETGGNVEGSQLNEIVNKNGVILIGQANLPGLVPVHASQVYSANLFGLIDEFWNTEEKRFSFNLEDEIIQGCLITHQGAICHKKLAEHYQSAS